MFATIKQSLFKHVFLCKRHLSSIPSITPRIFSGIQPTGIPHIGNYFGAIKLWVDLQHQYDSVIYCIVDLHSLTTLHDPQLLRSNTIDMTAALLGCGIDPEQSILFQQSHVPAHTELAWVLGCLTTLPRLQHLKQWKDKSETMKEVPLGLFTYPVLQAADILLYRATHVPVGDDQLQNIELTRHLANKFNTTFGTDYFPRPKPIITDFKRIRSLRTVGSKMSKSKEDARARIELLDSPDEIRSKIKIAVTDSDPSISYDPVTRPGVSNLIAVHCAACRLTPGEVVAAAGGMDTVQYKNHVAEVIIEVVSPLREEILRLKQDEGFLERVLQTGAERAREIAENNLKAVKQLVGLR